MPHPTVKDLPPPPPGKTGWPWTVDAPLLAPTRPDGSAWPSISIVTPSYNQGQFLEETIRSILLQGYPHLQYFVMDGGSTDDSAAVIEKYAPWLDAWRSARDNGQADAVNRGLALATGEIFQFINSDDFLPTGALEKVAAAWPAGGAVAGSVLEFDGDQTHLVANCRVTPRTLLLRMYRGPYASYHQPGVWLDRAKLAELGGFEADLRYCFDFYSTTLYFERWPDIRYIPDVLVHFRIHGSQKTTGERDGVTIEYARARGMLGSSLRSAKNRRDAQVGLRRSLWPSAVETIRRSSQSNLRKAAVLAWRLLREPEVAFNRLTLGAIRRELTGRAMPPSEAAPRR
jgi:glycosyltransferase involved in cell wall biosynthesis